jgi:RHS repeat-associated protein
VKFTEKERDKESGWDYFGARNYDSDLGRWLQVDPLADKYPGWSPYNYCHNNPLNRIDIMGMYDKPDTFVELVNRIWHLINFFDFSNDDDDNNSSNQSSIKDEPAVKALNTANKIAKTVESNRKKFNKNAVKIIDETQKNNEKIQIITDISQLGIPIPKIAGRISNLNKASNIIMIVLDGAKYVFEPTNKNLGKFILDGVTFGGTNALGDFLGKLEPEYYDITRTYLDPILDGIGYSVDKLVEEANKDK